MDKVEQKKQEFRALIGEWKSFVEALSEEEKVALDVAGDQEYEKYEKSFFLLRPRPEAQTEAGQLAACEEGIRHCSDILNGLRADLVAYRAKRTREADGITSIKLLARFLKLPKYWRQFVVKRLDAGGVTAANDELDVDDRVRDVMADIAGDEECEVEFLQMFAKLLKGGGRSGRHRCWAVIFWHAVKGRKKQRMSDAPTQEEIEALYNRVVGFITRLRSSQSPALNVRNRIHCKQLQTHYKLPLTGANQLRIDYALAADLEATFPGWILDTEPTPDAAQFQYVLLIPLECATAGRVFNRKIIKMVPSARYVAPPAGDGGFERPLILLLLLVVLGLGGYQFLFK